MDDIKTLVDAEYTLYREYKDNKDVSIKNDLYKKYSEKSKELTKILVDIYPFLMPRNVFTDKLIDDYDYNFCGFKDDIPHGWWRRGGLEYLDDLKEVLEKYDYVNDFRFMQVKEKFGELRVYHNGIPEEWESHEHAGKYISKHTCVKCGKFPVPMRDDGGVSPGCDECFKEHLNNRDEEYIDKWTINKDNRLLEYLVINYSSKEKDWQEIIDMKPYYDKIGGNYTKEDLISKKEAEEIEKENLEFED